MFMPVGYGYVVLFMVVGAFMVLGAFIGNWLLAPSKPTQRKSSTYECGIIPTGEGWIQYNVRYYLFALIFLIFDVETVFLIPWAVVFRRAEDLGISPVVAFVEMGIFIFILLVGLAYAWRKGVLRWV
ncbi:MAG: NADH-quinone oxidoreductase subunit A [bacterium]|nr:NADH-quinone oxidoreductase subunit A [bacterium]